MLKMDRIYWRVSCGMLYKERSQDDSKAFGQLEDELFRSGGLFSTFGLLSLPLSIGVIPGEYTGIWSCTVGSALTRMWTPLHGQAQQPAPFANRELNFILLPLWHHMVVHCPGMTCKHFSRKRLHQKGGSPLEIRRTLKPWDTSLTLEVL